MLLNSVYALQLQSSITGVLDILNGFAADPLFAERFELVFGKSISSSAFQAALASLPQFEVRSDGDLAGALGAFSAQTQKIYLTESLLTGDPARLQAVMIEEIGHFLDAQVNTTDTAGDEGELFSDFVRGVSLSSAELGRIEAEDDHAVVMIDGEEVAIEQNISWIEYQYASDLLSIRYDNDNNFSYENVSKIGSGFRSRFGLVRLPSGDLNANYNQIGSGGVTGNTDIIALRSTINGLIIHTRLSGTFTTAIGDAFLADVISSPGRSFFTEDTFTYQTPANLGSFKYVSNNNPGDQLKITFVDGGGSSNARAGLSLADKNNNPISPDEQFFERDGATQYFFNNLTSGETYTFQGGLYFSGPDGMRSDPNAPPASRQISIFVTAPSGSGDFVWQNELSSSPPPPPGNRAPLVNIYLSGGNRPFSNNLTVNNVFFDPDGDSLDGIATLQNGSPLPNWFIVKVNSNGSVTFQVQGTYPQNFTDFQVKLTATDLSGASVSQVFSVLNQNGGFVIDPYIVGATVFFDASKDGILNSNEPFTYTDINGAYQLNIPDTFDINGDGQFSPSEGLLVVLGGIDTATGLSLSTPIIATSDSTILTLLSNLIVGLVNKGLTTEEAQAKLKEALSLPSSFAINQTDPIQATNNN